MTPQQAKTESVAFNRKPPMGAPCNNCGWCCLTWVCPMGAELTQSNAAPCKLLITHGDRHYCRLASDAGIARILDIGGGCDSITVEEKLETLMAC